MSPTPEASLAACRAFAIVEILESVLEHLDMADLLLKAQLVNHFWRSCIRGSVILGRICYLRPQISCDEDPHFRINVALADITGRMPSSRSCQALRREHAIAVRTIHDMTLYRIKIFQTCWNAYAQVRIGVKGRGTKSWLTSLQQMETMDLESLFPLRAGCRVCTVPHDTFRYEHLHPLLRDLRAVQNVCVSGYGDKVILQIVRPNGKFTYASMVRDTMQRILRLLHYQSRFPSSRHSVAMKPACTELVVTSYGQSVRVCDGRGLNVGQFAMAMARVCYDSVCHYIETTGGQVGTEHIRRSSAMSRERFESERQARHVQTLKQQLRSFT